MLYSQRVEMVDLGSGRFRYISYSPLGIEVGSPNWALIVVCSPGNQKRGSSFSFILYLLSFFFLWTNMISTSLGLKMELLILGIL